MSKFVFANPKTGRAYQDIRKVVKKALKKAGLEGVWIHDLRRSFITLARKSGVAETVTLVARALV